MASTITRDELKRKIDRGEKFTLLEALGEDSYRRAHLPGAQRIPDDQPVEKWSAALVPDKNREVVTYCMNPM